MNTALKFVVLLLIILWVWRSIVTYKTEESVFTKTWMYACLFGLMEAFIMTFVGCAALGAIKFLMGW